MGFKLLHSKWKAVLKIACLLDRGRQREHSIIQIHEGTLYHHRELLLYHKKIYVHTSNTFHDDKREIHGEHFFFSIWQIKNKTIPFYISNAISVLHVPAQEVVQGFCSRNMFFGFLLVGMHFVLVSRRDIHNSRFRSKTTLTLWKWALILWRFPNQQTIDTCSIPAAMTCNGQMGWQS